MTQDEQIAWWTANSAGLVTIVVNNTQVTVSVNDLVNILFTATRNNLLT